MNFNTRTMLTFFIIGVLVLTLASCAVLGGKKFGKNPSGEELARIESSPNYKDGEFKNTVPTQTLAENQSTLKIIIKGLFSHTDNLRPEEPLPTVRLDLKDQTVIPADKDVVIWLGHSGFFIQLDGKRILIDPVFNNHGAPFSFLNKIFPGTDIYTAADMPEIDYLLISHDHWDHLDYKTVTELLPKVKKVICPLGIGADFKYWGYPDKKIYEEDWEKSLDFGDGINITFIPARHYSGRLFSKNKTLWTGYVLESAKIRMLFSGDSGFGPHFKEVADKFEKFDLVALDGGQYDSRWPLIHMTPEEAVKAAEILDTKNMLLAHVGRFAIAAHSWKDPFLRAVKAAKSEPFKLLTPEIGQPIWFDGRKQNFTHWWEGLK